MAGQSSPKLQKASVADIVVADDHVAIAMIVQHVIKSHFAASTSHAVDSGDALLDLLGSTTLGPAPLVVLDLHMPGRVKSLALVSEVKKIRADSRVLVYSGHERPCLVAAALEAGADGYVPKTAAMTDLEAAMGVVGAGDRYVSATIDLEAARQHPWNRLTAGEREVLSRIARGNSLQDIAFSSQRSYSTISAQKYSALRKLKLSTDDGLLPYLMEQGLSYVLDKGPSQGG